MIDIKKLFSSFSFKHYFLFFIVLFFIVVTLFFSFNDSNNVKYNVDPYNDVRVNSVVVVSNPVSNVSGDVISSAELVDRLGNIMITCSIVFGVGIILFSIMKHGFNF